MATTREQQYTGVRAAPDFGYASEDPRGVPTAVPPSRSPFTFPSRHTIDEDLALDFLGTICVYFTIFGFAFLALGVISIVLCILFAISVPKLITWMLIVGGLVSFLHFCLIFGAPGTTSFFLLGTLHLAIGLWLLIQSSAREGMAFVWIMLGWFIAHGVIKLILSYEVRTMRSWPTVTTAGAAAIVLGILNVALVPAYGLSVLGILLGVDMAITALSILLISVVAYQVASQISPSVEPLLAEQC